MSRNVLDFRLVTNPAEDILEDLFPREFGPPRSVSQSSRRPTMTDLDEFRDVGLCRAFYFGGGASETRGNYRCVQKWLLQ